MSQPERSNRSRLREVNSRVADATSALHAPETLAEEVATLVANVVGDGCTRGGGTLLDEPILVLSGGHHSGARIFDQGGTVLGTTNGAVDANRVPTGALEIRDAQDRIAQQMQDRSKWWSNKWRYALSAPGSAVITSIDKIDRKATCAITVGPRRVGTLRKFDPRGTWGFGGPDGRLGYLLVEDDTGRQLADIRVARCRSRVLGPSQLDIIVQLDQRATTQMRWVALAAGVIVDSHLLPELDDG